MAGPIIGVDEVGLGSWAGPLVVCAFAAPSEEWVFDKLNDSKKVSKMGRARLCTELIRETQNFELIWVPSESIDKHGAGRVHMLAMEKAVEYLAERVGTPWRVIVDGNRQPLLGAECYPKADATYPCVMAASIIAKVKRDAYMVNLARKYPQYGFEKHVGYGTQQHLSALLQHGLSPVHRRSYKPMSSFHAPSWGDS